MKRIIMDCDPGHDDAVALMLAVLSQEVEIVGVTTVGGNSGIENTTRNARRILDFVGAYGVQVRAGCDRPLLREPPRANGAAVHGADGISGVPVPEAVTPVEPEHAIPWIIRTLRESREKLILVPTGPLTNIAQVLTQAPEVKEKIQRIVFMGGAVFAPGNITTAAEFNIYTDPEAAKIVLHSGVPCDMVGLDVTMKALFSTDDGAELRRGGRVSRLAADLLESYGDKVLDPQGRKACPIHDALTVGTLIDEELVRWKESYVDISTHDPLTRGETVADVKGASGCGPNCRIAVEVDRERFLQLLKERLHRGD